MTPTTTTCRDCGVELPEATLDAADLVYGPCGSGLADRLLDALERAVRRADTEPMLMADPERDEHAGQSALLEALHLDSFAALVRAYRHFGRYGECRP